MGIMDFVKGGVREMMVARPDNLKHLLVYKHPDQNVPMYSQLTVDSDECALFFKDGKYMGYLPAGRHTLQTQNIPFLNNLITSFTGGNVLIAEIFFVKMQPVRDLGFGGPLEPMEDPVLYETVTPRIFGVFAAQIVDPVKFVIGYYGQAAGSMDNEQTLRWVKGKFMMGVTMTITEILNTRSDKSLQNLGGMAAELQARIGQHAPNLDEIGIKIVDIGEFHINLSDEDKGLLREANKKRAEARREVSIAADTAKAKQFELDQKFGQDARYVQQLAGNYQNYAAGQAMMGAGQGMAQGGANAGVAGLGAQMAVGMNMANMMQQPAQGPQFTPAYAQQPHQAGQPAAPTAAGGKVPCPKCAAQVPMGKFCAECGTPMAAPAKKFCSGCGAETGAAKFCANCGTPAGAA